MIMRQLFGTEVNKKEEKACGIYGKDFIVADGNTFFENGYVKLVGKKNSFILNVLLLIFALTVCVSQYQIKSVKKVNV